MPVANIMIMKQVLFNLFVLATRVATINCTTPSKPFSNPNMQFHTSKFITSSFLAKLLVASGCPYLQNALNEVIDLTNPSLSCQSWADHPRPNTHGEVGEIINDKLLICGGIEKNGPTLATDSCFEIGRWSSAEAAISLNIGSTHSASVSINGSMFVSGGISKISYLSLKPTVFF